MDILPSERVSPSVPFENTGLDFMGPFGVKMNGRATHKVWACVFTCFSSRAVHAEIVYKMDADSLINAITRFSTRRPGTRRFFSDRGSNLTCADRVLKKELEELNAASSRDCQRQGIQWDFIPAGTPHRGGVWERVIGLFKRHLALQSNGDPVHVDVFNTLVVEIEGIINRRPLTALSDNPKDFEPLTPSHILYPGVYAHSSAILVPVPFGTGPENARTAWKQAQTRVNSFWSQWSQEYVTLLHSRKKWHKTRKNLENGDLVLIVDEQMKRCEWNLGRVINADSAKDHVRKAEILKVDGKTVTKDRTKLVLLELDEEVDKIPIGQH